jgi:hypothetical protein
MAICDMHTIYTNRNREESYIFGVGDVGPADHYADRIYTSYAPCILI